MCRGYLQRVIPILFCGTGEADFEKWILRKSQWSGV